VRFILYMLFGVGGALVALAFFMVFFSDDETAEVAPQTQSIEVPTKPADESKSAAIDHTSTPQLDAITSEIPSVDIKNIALQTLNIEIARVKPDGAAVVAGSAPPGVVISVFEDRLLLGRTTADSNGEWVVVLEKRLGPGQHLISVAAELEDGSSIVGEISIAIEIYADQSVKPLVALLPESQTDMPALLQSPDDDPAGKSAEAAPTSTVAHIRPRSLVWQDDAKLSIGGQSRGGVRVTVSANGAFFGDALVMADGSWQLTGQVDKKRNAHSLEFILVDNAGQAVARYALPVRMRDLQKGLDGSQLVIVNKGDALWRIAYRSFGKGVRYIDNVRKNTGDIDNPDLIYPNQIFALPKPDTTN